MEFQHELVIPDEGLPFKFFLFEGSQGNYVREKHGIRQLRFLLSWKDL